MLTFSENIQNTYVSRIRVTFEWNYLLSMHFLCPARSMIPAIYFLALVENLNQDYHLSAIRSMSNVALSRPKSCKALSYMLRIMQPKWCKIPSKIWTVRLKMGNIRKKKTHFTIKIDWIWRCIDCFRHWIEANGDVAWGISIWRCFPSISALKSIYNWFFPCHYQHVYDMLHFYPKNIRVIYSLHVHELVLCTMYTQTP